MVMVMLMAMVHIIIWSSASSWSAQIERLDALDPKATGKICLKGIMRTCQNQTSFYMSGVGIYFWVISFKDSWQRVTIKGWGPKHASWISSWVRVHLLGFKIKWEAILINRQRIDKKQHQQKLRNLAPAACPGRTNKETNISAGTRPG